MGKITKIEVQKKYKDRVNVYIDEKFAFAAFADIVFSEGIKKGIEIDEDTIEKVNLEERLSKCKNDAIRIVERSVKTEKQVIDKLKEKDYLEREIDYAIDFLKEYAFLDDRRLAKSFAESRLSKYGKSKIRYELKKKGIKDNIILDVLDCLDNDLEFSNALEVATKKYNQIIKRETDKYKIKNKLYSFLAGRGYDFDLIKRVIGKVLTESDDFY